MTRSVARADVGRALLAEHVEQLVDEPGDARQRDPVAPEDRRAGREVGPEQLVGRVDQVELHRGRAQDAVEPVSTSSLSRTRSAWKIAPRVGVRASAPRWGSRGGIRTSSQRTIVVVPSAPASRVIRPWPLNEPSWLIPNRWAARTP